MRRLSSLLLSLALALTLVTPVFADTSYVVQPGDTLTRIAARHNVSVEAIVQANRLPNANVIYVGQVLTIPGPSPAPAPAGPGPATPAGGGGTYIVQSGDSLYRLAARFNVTVDALIAANNLTSTTLQIGQVLNIPGAAPAPPNSIYGRISGTPAFTQRIVAALDWLQAHDAAAFQRVDTYVTSITASPYTNLAQARALNGGGCLVRALARSFMSTPMVAALLFHEATHCYQFATMGFLSTKEAEVFAYSEQIAFMERNGYAPDEIAYYQRVLEYYASQPDDGRYIPPPNF